MDMFEQVIAVLLGLGALAGLAGFAAPRAWALACAVVVAGCVGLALMAGTSAVGQFENAAIACTTKEGCDALFAAQAEGAARVRLIAYGGSAVVLSLAAVHGVRAWRHRRTSPGSPRAQSA